MEREGVDVASMSVERRSEPRRKPDKYCYVELKPTETGITYQFRIWDLSSRGMCLLVRPDSDILTQLHLDDELEMSFHPEGPPRPPQVLTTRIRHITLEAEGRFKGHYLVGLLILESREETDSPPSAENS
jgi:hypothetical protein